MSEVKSYLNELKSKRKVLKDNMKGHRGWSRTTSPLQKLEPFIDSVFEKSFLNNQIN